MHGRVKVKTTEQQDREKKIERDAKLKVYRQAMSTIQDRRSDGHKDETQLKATSQVLQMNPDLTTLWNIRKEVLLHLINSGEEGEEGDGHIEKDVRLIKELELTQSCLMVNPKSYGSWHHRTWSLENMDNPNWTKELMLCDRYLKLDERNFHCWDYRKWVAAQANVSCQDELEFTMEKIGENFSNYSAWHYRSKLLPILFPGEKEHSIQEENVHSELDLVQNAAFTDPEDSSAWFYHTWLLGKEEERTSMIYSILEDNSLAIAFTKPVEATNINVKVNHKDLDLIWTGEEPEDRFNSLWRTNLQVIKDDQVKISLLGQIMEFSRTDGTQLIKGEGWKSSSQRFINLPNKKTEIVLKQALDNCNQLLELEPESKWTLFTKTLTLQALDSQANHQEIIASLSKLEEIDSPRKNYYADFSHRVKMEYYIEMRDIKAVESETSCDHKVGYHLQYLPALKI